MKLGSLFDGSGGFPLAATHCGIEPVWASEVEPYPIAVTRAHFPGMIHLGDVATISGSRIEPVDVITFGSPCQDLSVCSSTQLGFNGERSSLFFEAIRIIKEMRDATKGEKPRFAVWENVLGALSSNGGGDFERVLSSFLAIHSERSVDRFDEVWRRAGAIVDGRRFSLAWRVLNSQFWGTLQRRRRVFLAVDFGGSRAVNLFKSLRSSVRIEADEEATANDSGVDSSGFETSEFYTTSHANFDRRLEKNIFGTLTKSDRRTPQNLYRKGFNPRKVTPGEYGNLQGFPRNWGKIGAIDDEEFPFWRNVWSEYSRVFKTKERSDANVRRWMKSPYSAAREYEMWGNGLALPCAEFALQAITYD